jgi:3-oxoacyl-[acyl-carrier protein] reductase
VASSFDAVSARRVAIVTGGSRGVGRATVNRLAARGYAVVVDYLHDQRAAESTVETVLADHGTAMAVRADVADDLDVERLFAETIVAFGCVDVVVHTVDGRIASTAIAEVDLAEFDAVCRLNTRATLIVNREAARQLRNGGAIVNLSSSTVASVSAKYGAYAASKAATDVLTRTLAVELRDRDITVNAVSLDIDQACVPNRIVDVIVPLLGGGAYRHTGRTIHVGPGA